jgi:cysteinyl-tRNA synthetase
MREKFIDPRIIEGDTAFKVGILKGLFAKVAGAHENDKKFYADVLKHTAELAGICQNDWDEPVKYIDYRVKEALMDDLNTPLAITILNELASKVFSSTDEMVKMHYADVLRNSG